MALAFQDLCGTDLSLGAAQGDYLCAGLIGDDLGIRRKVRGEARMILSMISGARDAEDAWAMFQDKVLSRCSVR